MDETLYFNRASEDEVAEMLDMALSPNYEDVNQALEERSYEEN